MTTPQAEERRRQTKFAQDWVGQIISPKTPMAERAMLQVGLVAGLKYGEILGVNIAALALMELPDDATVADAKAVLEAKMKEAERG